MKVRVCPKCGKHNLENAWNCADCGQTLSMNTLIDSEHGSSKIISAPSAPSAPTPSTKEVRACSVCGRQDETLRVVTYPYVFSLVVVTFRRAFAGLWCRRHRTLWLTLASLITATIGWIGIPFGFLFTPVALFKLARGGDQPVERNVHLLKNLAEHKLKEGDPQGAIRCLEAGLQLRDDETIRERLHEVRTNFGLPVYQAGCQRAVLAVAAVLLSAVGIGTIIGVLDYVITSILSSLMGEEALIYEVILSWAPFVAMAFIGGLALSQLIEWALARIKCRRLFLATGMGIVTAVLTAYSLLQGSVISDYVAALLSGGAFESVFDAIFTSILVLLLGGLFRISEFTELASTSEVIYIVLLLFIVVYYLIMAVLTAVRTTQWQQRLVSRKEKTMADQQPYYQPPPQKRSSAIWWITGGCGAILVLVALCACGLFALGGAGLLSLGTPGPIINRANYVNDLVRVGDDLWAATDGGVLHWNLAGGTCVKYTAEHGLVSNSVEAIAVDGEGALWFGTKEGVSHFDRQNWTTYTERDGLANNDICAIALDADGALWFGTWGGVSRFDRQNWTTYTAENGLADDWVKAIAMDGEGALWFGTWGGVSRFDGQNWTTYTEEDGLANNRVNAIAVDGEGVFWFGTKGGVSGFDRQNWTTYTEEDGLASNWVEVITVDEEGALWFGMAALFGTGGGVSRFDGENWTTYTEEDGLADNWILAIAVDEEGALWFGTKGGVSRFDGENWTTYTE